MKDTVEFVIPGLNDLWFRRDFMSDPQTMSYNHACGGTIPFPREEWAAWYDHWIVNHEGRRFYRYVTVDGAFVGEAAYHWDGERAIWCADVVIAAGCRRRGYGRAALQMLCAEAQRNGIDVLRDDIAVDNPAIGLFLNCGFTEEFRTNEYIMLKKELMRKE